MKERGSMKLNVGGGGGETGKGIGVRRWSRKKVV